MTWIQIWPAALIICCALRGASGAEPVIARTIEDRRLTGSLLAIDELAVSVRSEREERRIALADLLELTWNRPAQEAAPHSSYLFLTSGDRLVVQVLRLQEDMLDCRWEGESDVSEGFQVALESVRGIVLQPALDPRAERSLERELQVSEFEADVLILTNGDRLSGVLEALTPDNCRCETAVGALDVNRSRVRTIGFNSTLLEAVEPAETEMVLTLTDGSWLTCRTLEWDGRPNVEVKTVTGADIAIPVGKLRSISRYGPRVTPLSDLEPVDVVMTPYLSRETAMQRDRNAYHGPLTVRGETFAKGLGMSSRTTATYALKGGYSSFRVDIGIDDAAGGAGSVVFAVDVDGQRVFESGFVTGRDDALSVGPIDVRHAETITLSVDYGTQGDIGDVADWCNPVLIRGERLKPED